MKNIVPVGIKHKHIFQLPIKEILQALGETQL